MSYVRSIVLPLAIVLPAVILGGCAEPPPAAVDGYIALVPQVLRVGEREAISVSLLAGEDLSEGAVRVALVKDGQPILEKATRIKGKGAIEFQVPKLAEGDYELKVSGPGFADEAQVQVQQGTLLFVETDKPIYKPGQTIHIRVIALNSELKPVTSPLVVEVQDAKGIKVFKRAAETDEYGMAALDLPLSDEPNLGMWKVTGQAGERTAQVDVRVEEYVLPKYEVKVSLAKEWFLVDEPIAGRVTAEYSFGKPVKGELEIRASRYLGVWEQFATFDASIDGEAEFELPAVGYVAGVPEARGMGNVTLEVAIKEKATGYEEKTTELITVASAPLSIQIVPESPVFKPTLPFTLLIVTETPDNQPVDATVRARVTYLDEQFSQAGEEEQDIETRHGVGLLKLTPPAGSVTLTVEASSGEAYAYHTAEAGYSPSGNFIHVEQVGPTDLKVGDEARFKVYSTSEAANFYYEVLARGRVAFTDFTSSQEISFPVTPLMAPSSKLLVYQILPTSEVAADYIPFNAQGSYPHSVSASFSREEAAPGEPLQVQVQTEGAAKVGLAAVDRSVFILAENRLNLQQVFEELERLYMEPQVELHEAEPWPVREMRGAEEIFQDAGVVVLSNMYVPEGKELEGGFFFGFEGARGFAFGITEQARPAPPATGPGAAEGLAEVQRIRQFFPETWIWSDITTDDDGKAALNVEAPDSITTWDLRAVGLSKDKGLGIAETSLRVFQPFFLQVDLPYSAIRGEELPLKVSLYNYTDEPLELLVELEPAAWFDLLDEAAETVTVAPSDIGGAQFMIRPNTLGTQEVKVTARSRQSADAVIKPLIVAPEGVEREMVDNLILNAGASKTLELSVPLEAIEGSARAYLAATGSYLTQTIEGLDQLLQMPFGCGEQNMILFAPDAFILRYLKGTGQLKAETMAKAEKLLITGYQRQLTYQRADGSFSAFGDEDTQGSLFLTAFVLKTFHQAQDLVFIDESVLSAAKEWIVGQQQADGSFQEIGFVAHEELMGGVQGKTALTAYVAIALEETGESQAGARAIQYLEGQLDGIADPYTLAIVTYALELADSPLKEEAYAKLMAAAEEDENGLHWGGEPVEPLPQGRQFFPAPMSQSVAIEATGYASLALLRHGDQVNASRAAKWLVAHRNSLGGFGSTQDTVVALQALTEFASAATADVDLALTVTADDRSEELRITPANFDVLQVIDLPAEGRVTVEAQGKGQVVLQAVRRFNLPEPEEETQVFKIDVDYGTEEVEVNDLLQVNVSVEFAPPEPLKAGMVVLDIAVPTGFSPLSESIDRAVQRQEKVKRYDIAGRKVIFYIEDMLPGEQLTFSFDAQALYPVKAKGVASQAYSYYRPEWRGETVGEQVTVVEGTRR